MSTRLLRKIVLFGGMFLLIGVMMPLSAWAIAPGPPRGFLTITEVSVIFGTPNTIEISGENFEPLFPQNLNVTLGDYGSLDILDSSNTMIKAELPAGIPGGDYLLTVSTGIGYWQIDEYDLTIRACEAGGVSGYQQVENYTTIPENLGRGSVFWVEAQCPGGKKVLGGGIRLTGNVDVLENLRVFESQPASETAWRASAIWVAPLGTPTPGGGPVTLKAFAICGCAE